VSYLNFSHSGLNSYIKSTWRGKDEMFLSACLETSSVDRGALKKGHSGYKHSVSLECHVMLFSVSLEYHAMF